MQRNCLDTIYTEEETSASKVSESFFEGTLLLKERN